jgi:hypothetical protein
MVCFQTKKSQFASILECLAIENLGEFYDRLVYFTAIGNILFPLGIFVVIWYIFPRFGILDLEKSGNPVLHIYLHAKHHHRRIQSAAQWQ